jgi:hypothetical protein
MRLQSLASPVALTGRVHRIFEELKQRGQIPGVHALDFSDRSIQGEGSDNEGFADAASWPGSSASSR